MSMTHFVSAKPAVNDVAQLRRQAWRQLFGEMIEDRREAVGRTVQEAAALAGMEASEWLAVEAGHVPADPARLRSMAGALEVRWEDMATLVFICQGAWEV